MSLGIISIVLNGSVHGVVRQMLRDYANLFCALVPALYKKGNAA